MIDEDIWTIKLRYSNELTQQKYLKGNGSLYFAKNIGGNLSSKYGQNLLD